MKKTLILLLILSLAIAMSSCKKLGFNKADPCTEKVQIAALQVENNYLKAEIASLRLKLSDCESKITVTAVTTTTKPKVITTSRPAAAPTVRAVAPAPARDPVPQSTVTSTAPRVGIAKLDYLRQNGEIIFCVAANGQEDRYFPHFAIERGVTFVGTTDNAVKGYNWKVEPTEFMEGDYGVTMDGTFYVSDQLLKITLKAAGENLNSVEIKCPYTAWVKKPMSFDGNSGYWVFHTSQ